MKNSTEQKSDVMTTLGENLRRGFPVVISRAVVFDYTLASDGEFVYSYIVDGLRFGGKFNTHDAVFEPCENSPVWFFEDLEIHFNYTKDQCQRIFDFMLEKLKKNPSVFYFSDDPDHTAHLGFWLGLGTKFCVNDLPHVKRWPTPPGIQTLCTSQSGPVDAQDKQNALDLAQKIIRTAADFKI